MRLQLRIVGKDVDYRLAYYDYSGIFLTFEKYCLKYPPPPPPPSKLQQEKTAK